MVGDDPSENEKESSEDIPHFEGERSDPEPYGKITDFSDAAMENIRAVMLNYANRVDLASIPSLHNVGNNVELIRESFARAAAGIDWPAMSQMLVQLKNLSFALPALSAVPKEGGYSNGFHSPDDYFRGREQTIHSFKDLQNAVHGLGTRNPHLEFLWRGQQNASWGLHSSLYRELMTAGEVQSPDKPHRPIELLPTEVKSLDVV